MLQLREGRCELRDADANEAAPGAGGDVQVRGAAHVPGGRGLRQLRPPARGDEAFRQDTLTG